MSELINLSETTVIKARNAFLSLLAAPGFSARAAIILTMCSRCSSAARFSP